MTIRRSLVATATAVAAAGLLAACSGAAAAPTSTSTTGSTHASASTPSTSAPAAAVSPSNPYGEVTVDPPGPNDPVLTVTGGSAGPVALTLSQLEALGTQTITIDEPFVKKRMTFTGVPLSAVLARAGIPTGARINTKALNDYEYANLAATFVGSNALIATRSGSDPVAFDAGGPIRIVFPDGTPLSSVLDAWNWSLSGISVTTSGATASAGS